VILRKTMVGTGTRASRGSNRWIAWPTEIINATTAIAAPIVTHTGQACESNMLAFKSTQQCSWATKTTAASSNPRQYSRLECVGNFSDSRLNYTDDTPDLLRAGQQNAFRHSVLNSLMFPG
jgi:hypothetical protein